MENSTAFWLKIYSVYSSQQVVVYDADHPENIYEVLDFRPLAKTARSPVVYEILFERRVKKALERYRAAFKHLAKLEKQKKKLRAANQEEKNILRAVQQLPHRHSVADLSRSLRAQTGQRDHVIRGILAADPFMKRMETLFDQMGVPRELTRLSLVESSFNYKAISYAGAAGVWQFMPKSGKEFLMIRPDRGIDERISPLKSTVAAAKLLKRNYKFLGSWALAISAYNHGHSKLVKIPDAEKKFSRIGRIYAACERDRKDYRLGYASRNYYPEFLAMLHADAYKDLLYGEKPTTSPRSIVFHRVTRSRPALELVVKHGFSIHDFQLYNPDVRNLNKPLPKGFWYAVPGPSEDLAGLLPRSARRGGVTRTGI
jgi:membrane-bound lytic murein transglycosylase D